MQEPLLTIKNTRNFMQPDKQETDRIMQQPHHLSTSKNYHILKYVNQNTPRK